MFIILLLITGAFGECLYTHPDILLCKHIETFNITSSDAVFLDIIESDLTYIPLLTKDVWPRLEFITLWNSTASTCKEILKQTHVFYIDHNCKQRPVVNGHWHWHWPLFVIGICLLVISIIVTYRYANTF